MTGSSLSIINNGASGVLADDSSVWINNATITGNETDINAFFQARLTLNGNTIGSKPASQLSCSVAFPRVRNLRPGSHPLTDQRAAQWVARLAVPLTRVSIREIALPCDLTHSLYV